ncbi:RNA polymerase I specific initiation factor [Teratosphaeria destructans]|uniref:RNA polymerase I specific initiation factor n=1 Tax=Teratosphaeria destructans TaxID=418781 RepID=A0A9W7VZQ7_9PEZI|nr:RNA polymerase I specific initiation factor [Teratosphaeria destructans]
MFAPAFPQLESRQTFFARKQKRDQRKRRHETDADDDDSESDVIRIKQRLPSSDEHGGDNVRTHSVSRTDPYHVAGYSREVPLPPAPFPHAAVKTHEPQESVEEELAGLDPPLFTSKKPDQSNSVKRRHIENLTTVLHTCMLKGDWVRAKRAWSILLRTEVSGLGMDLRENGYWTVGAELLMRTDDEHGFRLAREYYDRLILQYPHTPRVKHSVNALAIYPALFNVWIYEVQDRFKKRRQDSGARRSSRSSNVEDEEDFSMASTDSDNRTTQALRQEELDEALPIATRIDDLLLSPPYDTSLPLLRMRGMVGLWLADLYAAVGEASGSESSDHGNIDSSRTRGLATAQRQRAMVCFRKVQGHGGELPQYVLSMLESGDDEMDAG